MGGGEMTHRILVFDDLEERRREWVAAISEAGVAVDVVVSELTPEALTDSLDSIERRREASRAAPGRAEYDDESALDEADALFIDYDLLNVGDSLTTGARLAYLARCYSKVSFIAVLNEHGTNAFDLTLQDHYASFADLDMGSDHLGNTGLWTDRFQGFRPWVWPLVIPSAQRFERRVANLLQHLDEPILNYIGLDHVAIPRPLLAHLESKGPADRTTFRSFVSDSSAGLRGRDQPLNDEAIARVSAARVAKWIEQLLVPCQEPLVDAPHLAQRFPSVARAVADQRPSPTCRLEIPSAESGIDPALEPHAYALTDWSSRPLWYYESLSSDETIQEVANPWSVAETSDVFCEDLSEFIPEGEARKFVADVPSPFVSRYVADFESDAGRARLLPAVNIDYRPLARLLVESGS
jgi:hypothetical protein